MPNTPRPFVCGDPFALARELHAQIGPVERAVRADSLVDEALRTVFLNQVTGDAEHGEPVDLIMDAAFRQSFSSVEPTLVLVCCEGPLSGIYAGLAQGTTAYVNFMFNDLQCDPWTSSRPYFFGNGWACDATCEPETYDKWFTDPESFVSDHQWDEGAEFTITLGLGDIVNDAEALTESIARHDLTASARFVSDVLLHRALLGEGSALREALTAELPAGAVDRLAAAVVPLLRAPSVEELRSYAPQADPDVVRECSDAARLVVRTLACASA